MSCMYVCTKNVFLYPVVAEHVLKDCISSINSDQAYENQCYPQTKSDLFCDFLSGCRLQSNISIISMQYFIRNPINV